MSLKDGNQCWSGTLNASNFGSMCAQPGSSVSEDCLFLNIWTPSLSPSKPLPVMFFIHGGGYNFGSGDMDGVPLVLSSNGSIILVSINYRLNGFGFLALSELTANSKTSTSGNYGVSDMITALKWVSANIANFGGDPQSVTIFGQSSGGTAILMLLISPLATGYFHKAILLSASTRVEANLTYAENQNRIFVENSNCSSATNVLNCIYGLTTAQVLEALPWNEYPYWGHATDFDLPNITTGDNAMLGIVDGYIIPMAAAPALASKKFSDVPVIFGSMAQEVDLVPPIIMLNYTESQYESYITYRFSPWNNASLIKQALEYYSFANYNNLPQLAYDTLSSDIHTTCGQTYLAKVAASAFQSPVYRYIGLQWPSTPICAGGDYCPHYAFHTWDLVALLDGFPSTFPVQASDEYFMNSLRKYYFELVINGTLSDWKTINSGGATNFVSMMFDNPNRQEVDYHEEECNFWWSNGFYMYSWNS